MIFFEPKKKLLCPFVSFVVIFFLQTQKTQKKTKEPQKQKAKG